MNNVIGGFLMPHAPILIKDIGRGEEKKSQKTVESMKKIASDIEEQRPETIVIVTPHGNLFRDAISINLNEKLYGDFHQFGNKNLQFSSLNDLKLANKISSLAEDKDIKTYTFSKDDDDRHNINHELDHGVLVPLYFIKKKYSDFKLVHINYALFSGEKLYEFGKLIKKASELLERKITVIASGDLSHRLSKESNSGYSPKGEEFDKQLINFLKENKLEDIVNFDKSLAEEAGECGLRSIQTILGAFEDLEIDTKVYSYEGPFGVGYGCVKLNVVDEYVNLAKKSIKTFLEKGEKLKLPEDLNNNAFYNTKAGTFVSLKKDGELRGCIGTIFPTEESLGKEIIENAVSAAFRDPRFNPLKKEELEKIEYSVDVLEKPEEINDRSKLNPKKYGVIVTKDSRKGVLLPNLEGVETVEKQLDIVLRKAGIGKDEDYTLEEMLIYAIQDEYLARAEYELIMNEFGEQRPFSNIIRSEEYHIELLKPLFEKYNVSIPEDNSREYVVLPEDIKAALKTGVKAEVENIAMYEKFLEENIPDDIANVFEELKRGSENHLRAFENGLERNGGFGQGYKG